MCQQNLRSDRQIAIDWAKDLLSRNNWLILDTETTGLDERAEAVEIAIIDKNKEVLFNSRIKPKNPISQSASKIHGITNKDLLKSPSFSQIYLELKRIVKDKTIIIYNSSFDRRILRQQIALNNLEPIKFDSDCVMEWYSQYIGDWNDYHQSYTWQKLPGGDHSALGDCRAVLKLIERMAGNEQI
jgi:DNA polymerase III subunit epsilon